jgi:hypothetical protein
MNDHEILRQLPQSVESEQSVLGALMLSPDSLVRVAALLKPEDFYRRDHQLIFRAMLEARDEGREFDAVTLGEWFESKGMSEQVAGGAYLVDLQRTQAGTAMLDEYVQIVLKHAIKRQQIEIGTEIVNRGFNCAEPTDISAFAIAELTRMSKRHVEQTDDPMDVFGDAVTPPVRPEWLPPGVAEYAADQARLMGVPTEMVAMGCLGAIATALHDNFVIIPKPNEPKWRERACLWIMLIAPPGSKKSAAIKRPMGPLRSLNDSLVARFGMEMAEYIPKEREFAIRQRDQIKRAAKGEGFEENVKPPEKPRAEMIFVRDATTEALGDLLIDNPRGLTYLHDELALWFGQFDAYRNKGASKDRPYALQAFDGGGASFNRIGRGHVMVPNWSYSVIGTIQPEKIREIAREDADDGLFQRFLTVEVGRAEVGADHDHVENARVTRDYNDAIEAVYRLQPGADPVVRLSPEAAAAYREFDTWIERMVRNDAMSPMLIGHISKWKAYWPRLALVYHVWGCVRSGRHPTSMPVSERTTSRVTAFLKRFILPQSIRFYQSTIGEANPVTNMIRSLASQILSTSDQVYLSRDFHRGSNAYRTGTDWQRKAALASLKDGGWLQETESGAYVVNPLVRIRFGERAAMETERRRSTYQLMKELKEAAAGRDQMIE